MSETPEEVVVDALEQAAFRGEWGHDPNLTALEASIETAEVVCRSLREAGFLPDPAAGGGQ